MNTLEMKLIQVTSKASQCTIGGGIKLAKESQYGTAVVILMLDVGSLAVNPIQPCFSLAGRKPTTVA